jgi:hypothetical protein
MKMAPSAARYSAGMNYSNDPGVTFGDMQRLLETVQEQSREEDGRSRETDFSLRKHGPRRMHYQSGEQHEQLAEGNRGFLVSQLDLRSVFLYFLLIGPTGRLA